MSENMSDKWVDYAVRIQSIAQAGLAYCEDKYGRERYEELRKISAEMISAKTDIPLEKVYDLFCNESGYQTPKLDTRGAVFIDGKILLVRENNGTWSLPGGWCDVDLSEIDLQRNVSLFHLTAESPVFPVEHCFVAVE